MASVRKTRRCLIVHEDTITAGFGAEIAAVLAKEAFFDLDAPIERLAVLDVPSPHSPRLLGCGTAERRVDFRGRDATWWRSRSCHLVADIVAPAHAEGTKATLLKWCKSVGDAVIKDEPLIELETDKVTVEIASPASGRLVEIVRQSDQEVTPGDVLGRISAGPADGPSAAGEPITADQAGTSDERATSNQPGTSDERASDPPVGGHAVPRTAAEAGGDAQSRATGRQSLSPSVRRLLAQHELAPDTISGSGRNGRITAQDVVHHAQKALMHAPSPAESASMARVAPDVSAPVQGVAGTRVPHTPMRRRIADHMARSLLEAPHVTTLFEVDLTRVMAHRKVHGAEFEAQGTRLTLTAYFIAACARALRAVPEVNATFHADAMELHADANIGIGTALGNKGLIVPVLRQVQTLNLFGIAQRLSEVVERARTGKLSPEEVRGGTFTISNHGGRRQPACRTHYHQSAAGRHSRHRKTAAPRLCRHGRWSRIHEHPLDVLFDLVDRSSGAGCVSSQRLFVTRPRHT